MITHEIPLTINDQNCIIYVQEWGDPLFDTIVCLHGLTRNKEDFVPLARNLCDQWHVLLIDMPGRGLSSYLQNAEFYTLETYRYVTLEILSHFNKKSFSLIGTSMGGLIGMTIASLPDSPLQRLVLNDIGAIIPADGLHQIATYLKDDKRFSDKKKFEEFARQTYQSFGLKTDQEWSYFTDISVERTPSSDYKMRYDRKIFDIFSHSIETIDLFPLWIMIKQPVLIIRGEFSSILTVEIAKDMLMSHLKAELYTISDCGHAPMLFHQSDSDRIKAFFMK
jgi:pimeloyl-ACP methyl ester carboxylesterase